MDGGASGVSYLSRCSWVDGGLVRWKYLDGSSGASSVVTKGPKLPERHRADVAIASDLAHATHTHHRHRRARSMYFVRRTRLRHTCSLHPPPPRGPGGLPAYLPAQWLPPPSWIFLFSSPGLASTPVVSTSASDSFSFLLLLLLYLRPAYPSWVPSSPLPLP
jgi:hypothetical protein